MLLRLQSYKLRPSILSPGVSCTIHQSFYCRHVQYTTTQTPKVSDSPPSSRSPHVEFYKLFGRPIAKVLLMSAFTYQLAYLLWVSEEAKERKAEKDDQIVKLEEEVRLLAATATTTATSSNQ